jgi:hypothetical protein
MPLSDPAAPGVSGSEDADREQAAVARSAGRGSRFS